jgi:hypothetical protein
VRPSCRLIFLILCLLSIHFMSDPDPVLHPECIPVPVPQLCWYLGGEELVGEAQHYWEVKMTRPVYGTDVMIGLTTQASLTEIHFTNIIYSVFLIFYIIIISVADTGCLSRISDPTTAPKEEGGTNFFAPAIFCSY